MIKKSLLPVLCILLMTAVSCGKKSSHAISDEGVRMAIENDLVEKMEAFGNETAFPAFSDPQYTTAEQEALKFLYAYMSPGDIADHSPAFYMENIRAAFRAKAELPWGKKVPEKIFLHFVLPVRVNNENLDSSRIVFYKELKERVRHLSMYDAALEVNHWCHEKVTYQPSDARTSSPLASVRTAYGRCGEESTFTVAALRAVGIPARQVYTPRWAHTDDNHAWVEAWTDGQWHYLGACEPAPVLDTGWFDAPVKRALLLHSKVFGRYRGAEDIMRQTNAFTEINVTSNYTPTAKTVVKVVDETGKAVKDARVALGIYNNCEIYTVCTTLSDEEGKASITTGLGDLSLWASKEDKIALQIVAAGKQEEYILPLNKKRGGSFVEDLDIVPPPEGETTNRISQAAIDANNRRLATEDSIRNAYIRTFISNDEIAAFARQIAADTALTGRFLVQSRGNWREIKKFMELSAESGKIETALHLLEVIAEKDLRDTPAEVLKDHLDHTAPHNSELFYRYVLNPRISRELLTPYRSWLQQHLPEDVKKQAATDPTSLIPWVNRLKALDAYNPQHILISPAGVMTLGGADGESKAIFFAALCRSLNIPARLEEVTGKLQYHFNRQWHEVNFETDEAKAPVEQGFLQLAYQAEQLPEDPLYDIHFTLAKIENGAMQRLNFSNDEGIEATVSYKSLFNRPVAMEEGYYLLITGRRMASGKVLCRVTAFNIEKGRTTPVTLTLREDAEDIEVKGSMNPEALFLAAGKSEKQSILTTTGRGYFIVGIVGAGEEPSNHFIRDLSRLKSDFEAWERSIILLFRGEKQWEHFNPDDFPPLPSTVTFGIDEADAITGELVANMHLPGGNHLPIVVIADTFGRVVYLSHGYKIGLGDELMQVIKRL